MNPLLLSALMQGAGAVAGAAFGQRGQRNPVDMAADAAGAAFANTAAQDVMQLSDNLYARTRMALDPNGQYARGFEQASARQNAQQFNQDQKIANEVAKRNFMVDQYRQAQEIGGGAINSYLAQQAQSRAGMRDALLTRY